MIDIGFASWVLKIRKIYQKQKLRSHSDMRRKDYSTMAIACIAILLLFLVFQFHLSSISRINATYSTINSQGTYFLFIFSSFFIWKTCICCLNLLVTSALIGPHRHAKNYVVECINIFNKNLKNKSQFDRSLGA
jgi:hypothetical protein